MEGTCNQGGECLPWVCERGRLIFLQCLPSVPYCRDTDTPARTVLTMTTCASAIQLLIPS